MKNTELRYAGQPAAPGVAAGPLVRRPVAASPDRPAGGTPAEECARLTRAMADAVAELRALAGREGGDAAAVLEFQIEMLNDSALSAPALAAIAAGDSAHDAWLACMTEHIANYRSSTDEHFRARATDCEDMRDRVARLMAGRHEDRAWLPEGAILLDTDLTPSRFLALNAARLGGLALINGSAASHVAVLARARGVPMICGIGREPAQAAAAILDAETGELVLNPTQATAEECARRIARRRRAASSAHAAMAGDAVTEDGERVAVLVNVDEPDAVPDDVLRAADGVGLVRTESVFLDGEEPLDEAAQYRHYAALLARVGDGPCVFRTLDVGGDKPLPGLAEVPERNPFLGIRGIRLCLDRPELFRPQIRALLRLAVDGRVSVMLPMVSVAEEYRDARALFDECLADLRAEGVAAAMPPLGIMIETPAAAIAIDTFGADFYSIGSNDLTQYTMAAARDGGGRVASLNRPGSVAMLRLIAHVVRHGRDTGREVSLCGDAGSNPTVLRALLATGLRRLSVAPSALGHVKQCIRQLRILDGDETGRNEQQDG